MVITSPAEPGCPSAPTALTRTKYGIPEINPETRASVLSAGIACELS